MGEEYVVTRNRSYVVESLAMGGYGAYVWSSFGLMFIVVVISAVQARTRHHRALRDVTRRINAMEAQE